MNTRTADIIVKIFAVLAILAGIGMLLSAFGLFRGGAALGANIPGLTGDAAATGLGLGGVIAIVLGILYLAVGWGLWTHKNWARVTMVVLAWIGLISGLLALFGVGAADDATVQAAGAGSTILSIIIAALEIWFFQFNSTVRSLFGAGRAATARASPVAGKR